MTVKRDCAVVLLDLEVEADIAFVSVDDDGTLCGWPCKPVFKDGTWASIDVACDYDCEGVSVLNAKDLCFEI